MGQCRGCLTEISELGWGYCSSCNFKRGVEAGRDEHCENCDDLESLLSTAKSDSDYYEGEVTRLQKEREKLVEAIRLGIGTLSNAELFAKTLQVTGIEARTYEAMRQRMRGILIEVGIDAVKRPYEKPCIIEEFLPTQAA